MWRVPLVFVFYLAAQVSSDEIDVVCQENSDPPALSNLSPSMLGDLKVVLVENEGKSQMNISWAVNIDASLPYLMGTRLIIDGHGTYVCEYHPSLAKANLTKTKEWFYCLVDADSGSPLIQAANVPFPPLGSGSRTKSVHIEVPTVKKPRPTEVASEPTQVPTGQLKVTSDPAPTNYVTIAIFGGLAALMVLSSSYIIYKGCRVTVAKLFGFKGLSTSVLAPVPVLMVYSPENSAFHNAVVALAEFLQSHGSCSVSVDMWQQGKIAELGPMRWLAEQVKAADRVLIVCPQNSSQTSHSRFNHNLPQPSIPAAAHDLYPLILNTVASSAKSSSKLDKFWVVQLGKQQDKMCSNLEPELRTCKTFCLMKDLNKLCESLNTHRQDKKISGLIFRPLISYSEKSTEKLDEAVKMLIAHQANISSESELLELLVR